MHKTFVMIKCDGVARGLIGKLVARLESKGLTILAMKMIKMTSKKAKSLYKEHKGKVFFEKLIKFTTSSPVVVMVVGGIGKTHEEFIKMVKHYIIGNSNCQVADGGTIRADFGVSCTNRNVIHTSATIRDANREIRMFFKPSEIMKYNRADHDWIYGDIERESVY